MVKTALDDSTRRPLSSCLDGGFWTRAHKRAGSRSALMANASSAIRPASCKVAFSPP